MLFPACRLTVDWFRPYRRIYVFLNPTDQVRSIHPIIRNTGNFSERTWDKNLSRKKNWRIPSSEIDSCRRVFLLSKLKETLAFIFHISVSLLPEEDMRASEREKNPLHGNQESQPSPMGVFRGRCTADKLYRNKGCRATTFPPFESSSHNGCLASLLDSFASFFVRWMTPIYLKCNFKSQHVMFDYAGKYKVQSPKSTSVPAAIPVDATH